MIKIMKIYDLVKGTWILVFACYLMSCDDKIVEMKDILVDPSLISINLGLRTQITAIPIPIDASDQEFEWISENSDIATVTRFGIVEAVAEGSTNIIVKKGTLQKTIPITVTDPVVIPPQKSSWLFEDPSNIGKAEIGQDLILIGEGFASIDGPKSGNKAVRIAKSSHFEASHGIVPNGGGTKVNEYTMLIDFKVPELGKWYSFYQTDLTNNSDAEVFINPGGSIGVGATGYSGSVIEPNKWSRLVISAKLGVWFRYYLDGELIHQTPDLNAIVVDDRFALLEKVILIGDNDGDDADIDIAEVGFWSEALDELQIKKLERQR
ncbi:Ig-like domain (group 2) [Porphyromonadaceae bacterium KH3R12]|nr:Ig-like domain (group 2) [Porphyromonadaceae bacterium KH3R12]